jgi:hypothetical protein
MPTFYGAIDLTKNELRNAVVQNLGAAPGTPGKGQLYMDTTTNNLYFYDGTAWVSTRSAGALTPAAAVTTSAVGDAATVGVSTNYARQDHLHGREAFGTITGATTYGIAAANGSAATLARSDHTHGSVSLSSTSPSTQAIGDGAAVGVGTLPAREDHKHGLPAFGVITSELTFGTAKNDGSVTTLARADHVHGNPTHDTAAHSTILLSGLAAPTASLNLNSQKIISLADPTAATDGANKQYVDNLVSGLSWKESCRIGSTANLGLSGLTAIDGVTPSANDRVLVKNQTTASANGIYLAAAGAWSRATDADAAAEINGMAVFIEEGTTLADTAWVCTTNAPITLGSTNLAFAQFSGGGAVTAGAGLLQNANAFDFVTGDTSLTVSADSVIVNTGVIATVASVTTAVTGMVKKFAAALTGTSSPETVTHNLNTRDIMLDVYNGATPYTAVEVDWDATTVNTAVIRYVPNLGAGYRVVVMG